MLSMATSLLRLNRNFPAKLPFDTPRLSACPVERRYRKLEIGLGPMSDNATSPASSVLSFIGSVSE